MSLVTGCVWIGDQLESDRLARRAVETIRDNDSAEFAGLFCGESGDNATFLHYRERLPQGEMCFINDSYLFPSPDYYRYYRVMPDPRVDAPTTTPVRVTFVFGSPKGGICIGRMVPHWPTSDAEAPAPSPH